MPGEVSVSINSERDVVGAREQARKMALEVGFKGTDLTLIATAVSELARNIVQYAKRGEVVVEQVEAGRRGLMVIARDTGPGISDINRAMQDGYSTGGGLGLGLPGAKRLMDDFHIVSEMGKGTTITMKKWLR